VKKIYLFQFYIQIQKNKPLKNKYLIKLIKTSRPELELYPLKVIQEDIELFTKKLLDFEKRICIQEGYKVGVLFCQDEINEDEMYSNNDPSEDFLEFLDFLGTKISLGQHKGYRGGLDVSEFERDGKFSVHTTFEEYEIMYHVSTYLPYSTSDKQQVDRKRFIGNDLVIIIFIDGKNPFNPSVISSHMNHVFIVVKKDKKKEFG